MKKLFYGLIGIIIIIGIITGIVLANGDYAELKIDRGVVQVLKNNWVPATDGMKLKLDDHVRTLDGEATILFDNLITQLDPNTEIIIRDLDNIAIEQVSGSTWNKLIGLLGGNQVTVKNQRIVAMVRGTSFGVGESSLLVGEGKVEGKLDGYEGIILADQILTLIDGVPGIRELTPEEKEYVMIRMKKSINLLYDIRLKEINDHPIATKIILKTAGINEPVEDVLIKVDNGEYDYKSFLDKSPVPLNKLKRVIAITEEIIKLNDIMNKFEES